MFNDKIYFSGKIILIPSQSNKVFNHQVAGLQTATKWSHFAPKTRHSTSFTHSYTHIFLQYFSPLIGNAWMTGLLINIKKKKTVINPTVGKLQKKNKENENRKRGRPTNMCDSGVGDDHCDGLMCEKRRTLELLRESTDLD